MTPANFQNLVLLWIGVLVVIIPLGTGVVILLLQQYQTIANAWTKLNQHDQSIKTINTQINGTLDQRIIDISTKVHQDAANRDSKSDTSPGNAGTGNS